MSRGFTNQEKHVITEKLIHEARVLFSQFGFQKTSIQDITQKVGIAQGTFYTFFESKEALYFVILEQEEEKMRQELFNANLFTDKEPKKVIKEVFQRMIQSIDSNPLIRQLFTSENKDAILGKLSSSRLQDHFQHDTEQLHFLFTEWEKVGVHFKEGAEVMAGILRSLFILTIHQQEIGEQVYSQTINRFIQLIVDGLVKEE